MILLRRELLVFHFDLGNLYIVQGIWFRAIDFAEETTITYNLA